MDMFTGQIGPQGIQAVALGDHVVMERPSWQLLWDFAMNITPFSVQIDTNFNNGAGFTTLLAMVYDPPELGPNAFVNTNAQGHVTSFGRYDTGETVWTLPEPIPAGETRYLNAVPIKGVALFFGDITDEPIGTVLNGW